MAPNQRKMRVGDLIIPAWSLDYRGICEVTLSEYRQAIRTGSEFPMPIVDTETHEVISGRHIVTAYQQELGEDHRLAVSLQSFSSLVDKLCCMVRENVKHGLRMSGKTKHAIAATLRQLSVPIQDIADLFCLPVSTIHRWELTGTVAVGNAVVQTVPGAVADPGQEDAANEKDEAGAPTAHIVAVRLGPPGTSVQTVLKPVKRGLDTSFVTSMTQAQYNEHWEKDLGVSIVVIINQLTRWMNNTWINKKDKETAKAIHDFRAANRANRL